MKKKSLIEYAVTFAVFCAGQLFLLIAGTPFCVAAATVITVGTLLTLLITKRYIPAAVFAVMAVSSFLYAHMVIRYGVVLAVMIGMIILLIRNRKMISTFIKKK